MLNVSDSWKITYPGAAAGVLIMRGVANPTRHTGRDQRVTGWEAKLRKEFGGSIGQRYARSRSFKPTRPTTGALARAMTYLPQ